jgi:hypothetical protein
MRNLLQQGEVMFLHAVESVQRPDMTGKPDDAAQVALGYLQVFPAYFAFRQGCIAKVHNPCRKV